MTPPPASRGPAATSALHVWTGGLRVGAGRARRPRLIPTVDANVLVYASNEADPAHQACRDLVERLASGPDLVYLFWPALLGYLRIVTHPGILPRPRTPAQAEHNIGELLARPHVRAPGEADDFWHLYQQTRNDPTRGNDAPDAHMATLMRQHGVETIYTRDRDFLMFAYLDVRDPTAT